MKLVAAAVAEGFAGAALPGETSLREYLFAERVSPAFEHRALDEVTTSGRDYNGVKRVRIEIVHAVSESFRASVLETRAGTNNDRLYPAAVLAVFRRWGHVCGVASAHPIRPVVGLLLLLLLLLLLSRLDRRVPGDAEGSVRFESVSPES